MPTDYENASAIVSRVVDEFMLDVNRCKIDTDDICAYVSIAFKKCISMERVAELTTGIKEYLMNYIKRYPGYTLSDICVQYDNLNFFVFYNSEYVSRMVQ